MNATSRSQAQAVDDYFADLPAPVRARMDELRATIRRAAPQAEETISYKMPAFTFHGILVYYAAFKNHIGFYPRVSGLKAFEKDLAGYKTAKGSVQFPLDRPLPLDIITNIVKFRVNENRDRTKKVP
jgi:uncharacterized protein YdhG (YjbR/CyaY superfamily)